jgi:hypothetical protein
MSNLRRLIAITGALMLLVVAQTPASAHSDAVFHGKDSAKVSSDHRTFSLCDSEKDGHWVYGEWYFRDGSSFYMYGDGAAAPCKYVELSAPVYKMMICEENKGCKTEKT